ncbi:putative RNA polymerase sigma-W factor [Plesiocystis pacifica SIR-1]|uniref:Putative RNA polymerase sigma-W factor n=1 Tax=Plesiocystis pacifica SIR-1 TaxID=391625 RepID=A6GGC0_9BACT|nr:sigma-70 family RNA polymerase sigma factor [Plesiocystis pacifica]EDM75094.1 putative RNA polymerase sigma-W factor [Plesiocystis pacifica SIR-1]
MRSDRELYADWSQGNKAAGAELFDRHFPAVYRFFRNKVGDDFEDLVQQTFTALLESKDRFRQDSSFRTFVFAIANNILRAYFRERRRDRLEFTDITAHDLHPGPSTIVARAREQQLLVEALRRIPLEHQVILELFYWESLTARAVGEIIGESEYTVRNRLRRGKELLRRHITELETNPKVLESTLGGLDRWVKSIHEGIE